MVLWNNKTNGAKKAKGDLTLLWNIPLAYAEVKTIQSELLNSVFIPYMSECYMDDWPISMLND